MYALWYVVTKDTGIFHDIYIKNKISNFLPFLPHHRSMLTLFALSEHNSIHFNPNSIGVKYSLIVLEGGRGQSDHVFVLTSSLGNSYFFLSF